MKNGLNLYNDSTTSNEVHELHVFGAALERGDVPELKYPGPNLYSGSTMSNGVPKLHVIGTDLERDDLSGLKYLLERYDPQDKFIFYVGEGPESALNHRAYFMAHLLDIAVVDGIIEQKHLENFSIVIGSPTPKQNDYAKAYYDINFIQKFENKGVEYLSGDAAKNHVIDYITQTKDNDDQVIFHLWKPMRDLPEIINYLRNTKVIDEYDMVVASGSFNANRLVVEYWEPLQHEEPDEDATEAGLYKAKQANKALNGYCINDNEGTWHTNNLLFESFYTFQAPDPNKSLGEINKHIFDSGTGSDAEEFQRSIDQLAQKISGDHTLWGRMAKRSALIWNRGLSEGCIKDCAQKIIEIADKNMADGKKSHTSEILSEALQKLEETMADEANDLSQINEDFIYALNASLSKEGFFSKEELDKIRDSYKYKSCIDEFGVVKFISGLEQKAQEFPLEFYNKLVDNEAVPKVYDWNIQVLVAMIKDSYEMLFGDLICAIYLYHPEWFHVKTSEIDYTQNKFGYLQAPDGEGVCQRTYGIKNFKDLIVELSGILVTNHHSDNAKESNAESQMMALGNDEVVEDSCA